MKRKSKMSLTRKKNLIAYTFVGHWALGLALFFLYPLISSIIFSFNNVTIEPGEIVTKFMGLANYSKLLLEDPNFLNDLRDSIGFMFYSFPIIISISLILAVLLNQKFIGRTFFRAVFFLPVMLSASVVLNLLSGEFITMPLFSSSSSGVGIIDYKSILDSINISSQIQPFLEFLLSNTIDLIWSCGVQTILFLAGLQSIPDSFYEVSYIEGANKWDEFWFITIPSLRNIISLVLIYTMIDLFADMKNTIVAKSYSLMTMQEFGESSAMLWFYFSIVLMVIGTVFVLYQRFCNKHWE